MGNIIGNINSAAGFNNSQQQDISSTIPYLRKLNTDAKNLINNLPVPTANITNFNDTENYDMYKIFEKNKVESTDFNATFSDTSPFISSDLYNNLIKQSGGGEDEDEDSSTTSSSSDKKTTKSELQEEMEEAVEIADSNQSPENKVMSDISDISVSDIPDEVSNGSYVSSSAHTDGVASSSSNISTISIGNNKILSDSVNTSDINMISVED
jgi:hypothetical protein